MIAVDPSPANPDSPASAPRPLNILHYLCTCRVADGGVPKAAIDLADGCARAGHHVTFLTWDDQVAPDSWKRGDAPNVRLVKIPAPKLPAGFFTPPQMEVFEDHLRGADVAHLHAMWTPSNLQVAIAARALGVPYCLSPHGMLDDWSMTQSPMIKRLFMLAIGSNLLANAAFVHLTAEAELKQASRWIARGNGLVIPLIMDLGPYRSLPGPEPARRKFALRDDGPTRLLFLSRIHPKKGVEALVRAAAILRDAGHPFELVIAGPDEGDYGHRMRALADELRLNDVVRFVGPVVGVEKVSLYQQAELFVLPSAQENFGFVFFEALAAGTAVLTTRAVDTWGELVESGGTVVYDPSESVELGPRLLADAIAPMLSNRDLLRVMGERGRAWTLEHLAADRVVGRYITAYRAARSIRSSRPG